MTTLYIFISLVIAFVISSLWISTNTLRRAIKLAPLNAQKTILEKEIASAQQTISAKERELKSKADELAKADAVIAEGKVARQWLENNQGKVQSLRQQISSTQDNLDKINIKLKSAQDEFQDKNEKLQDVSYELHETKQKLDEVKSQYLREDNNLKDTRNQLQSTMTILASKKSELQELESSISESDAKLRIRNQELADIEKRVNDNKSELRQLTTQRQQEEQKLEQISWDVRSKEAESQKLGGQVKQLEKQKEEKEKELTGCKEELRKVKAELSQEKASHGQHTAAVTALKLKKEELDKEIKDLNTEINRLKDTRNSVNAEVSSLQYELSGLEGKEKAHEKKWEDLDRKITTINIAHPKKYDEENWLEEFEDNLKACEFKFSSRLLKAFHTGLKVADCSPMVVLSGISGTGKSLLPELYAHAIGMNFLQVSVQPRWDSPQDMLGFYNYMEHRYKATELSRLLWQSDRFNNPEAAKNNPAMNLILLDEMNLARVEYYFSDMLSKLEVRRGLDPKDVSKRRAAEIVLESSAAGGTENMRRIFIGSNNLFVGTMNEDESTQALSDKVKDRANVLRFGRPKDLGGESADEGTFFKKYAVRMMTEEMWKSWMVPPGGAGISSLERQMNELNSILSLLNRPFAHRMWNTVKSYVEQYPGKKEDAWIDQIEMKILPKLSGLDMAEPTIAQNMNELGQSLQKLNDHLLDAAFSAATSRDFFTWQGIDR